MNWFLFLRVSLCLSLILGCVFSGVLAKFNAEWNQDGNGSPHTGNQMKQQTDASKNTACGTSFTLSFFSITSVIQDYEYRQVPENWVTW
jgi:hypothetical protein